MRANARQGKALLKYSIENVTALSAVVFQCRSLFTTCHCMSVLRSDTFYVALSPRAAMYNPQAACKPTQNGCWIFRCFVCGI